MLGLVMSVAVSVIAWWYFNTFLLFLLVPFVPILYRQRRTSQSGTTCPTCGFQSADPSVNFCPHDGEKLQE